MLTPCVIRFIAANGQHQAHVHRRDHGHPEEVITNLSYLKGLVDSLGAEPVPGSVATKFVILDSLWYAVWEIPRGELDGVLWEILLFPNRVTNQGESRFLRQHSVLDSTTPIEEVAFLYEVEQGKSDWQVKIGHNSESLDGPVDKVFQLVSWGFDGELSEALSRFQ